MITDYLLIKPGDCLEVRLVRSIAGHVKKSDFAYEEAGIIRRLRVGDVLLVVDVCLYQNDPVVLYRLPPGLMSGVPFSRGVTVDSGRHVDNVAMLYLEEIGVEEVVAGAGVVKEVVREEVKAAVCVCTKRTLMMSGCVCGHWKRRRS